MNHNEGLNAVRKLNSDYKQVSTAILEEQGNRVKSSGVLFSSSIPTTVATVEEIKTTELTNHAENSWKFHKNLMCKPKQE
jgi:hypothetical protein